MSRRFVQLMTDGDTIEEIYLISDKQLRANRKRQPLSASGAARPGPGAISAPLMECQRASFPVVRDRRFLASKGESATLPRRLADNISVTPSTASRRKKSNLDGFLPHKPEHDVNEPIVWKSLDGSQKRAVTAGQSPSARLGRMLSHG